MRVRGQFGGKRRKKSENVVISQENLKSKQTDKNFLCRDGSMCEVIVCFQSGSVGFGSRVFFRVTGFLKILPLISGDENGTYSNLSLLIPQLKVDTSFKIQVLKLWCTFKSFVQFLIVASYSPEGLH